MALGGTSSQSGQAPLLGAVWERVQRLLDRPAAGEDDRTARAIQLELARLVALRVDIELYHASPALAEAVEQGLAALERTPAALDFAREIRRSVEDRLSASSGVRRVVLGALIALALMLVVAFALIYGDYGHRVVIFLGFNIWQIWWYALSGAAGGVVSILLRIPDFTGINRATTTTQFYAGIFRPIIGGAFALLTFFLLNSHVLGIGLTMPTSGVDPVDDPVTNGLYLALSFLAGFSERLAPTLAARTEQALNASGPPDPARGAPDR